MFLVPVPGPLQWEGGRQEASPSTQGRSSVFQEKEVLKKGGKSPLQPAGEPLPQEKPEWVSDISPSFSQKGFLY